MLLEKSNWITSAADHGTAAITFVRRFACGTAPVSATLRITAAGVYVATLGKKRIGDFVLAPGWTSYNKRLQVQTYDVTDLLSDENTLEVTVANGWYKSRIAWDGPYYHSPDEIALIAELVIVYADGRTETIVTDESWTVKEDRLRFCEIYDGELYDASMEEPTEGEVRIIADADKKRLIEQEGEKITENIRVAPRRVLRTPKGELVVDFGQNLTGYVHFRVRNAKKGDRVKLKFFEILDKDGNVYTENYRSAKAELEYICADGDAEYKTTHTFYGFRMVRVDGYPGELTPDDIEAIAVYSDIKQTGSLDSSDPMLNKLFSNIFWGQRGNFLDVPTDCPQRDERLGWTGDTQVFCRTASYNFDCEKFYEKWLGDLAVDQTPEGRIPHVIPDVVLSNGGSSAWGDAAVIVPWQVYLTYGNKEILKKQFASMQKWVDYIEASTHDEYLWTGCWHYGDWCALDLGTETTDSASDKDFIASVYYANAVDILAKSAKVIGKDEKFISDLENKHQRIVEAIRAHFTVLKTQTEHALAIYFNIAVDKKATGDALAKLVGDNGNRLNTGFVGTPYLLHALSMTGHHDVAYSLLLQDKYPSWLFSVSKGATTIWEHWDGIKEDGSVWSASMNSYNHYAYGAVGDWVYGVAAGIQTVEEAPGFERVKVTPIPDGRIASLSASIDTRHGRVSSKWSAFEGGHRYEITVPTDAEIVIDGVSKNVGAGSYVFYGK